MSNIIADFIVENKIGLYCAIGDFYLDPNIGVKNAVISHAHGDHAARGNVNVFCTEPTKVFMEHRYQKMAGNKFFVKAYKETFQINRVDITLFSAGHMLGSAMVLMEYDGVKYLYTGDYKLAKDDTCEPTELVQADVLITESTFASSSVNHPNAEEEIKKLNEVKSNIMLGAYALGKSQRLISLINKHCPDKTILLHHNVYPITKIYTQLGVDLGQYQPYDRKLMKQSTGGMIYMVPPLVYNSYFRAVNVVRVFATGWAGLQKHNDVKLFISDHVDWKEILQTIATVNPKEVWTTHGNGKELQEYFDGKIAVKALN